MFFRGTLILAILMLGAGCSSGGDAPPLAANHPANPDAAESQIGPSSQTLAAGNGATPAERPVGTQQDMSGMSSSMPGMQHGDSPATTKSSTTQSAVMYTCPMHPQVMSDKPGKCSICGMNLVVKQTPKQPNHEEHE